MPEETAVQKVIDVVEDFSCPYQSAGYQEAFRSWRRKKQNPYAFRFTKNPKETAFSENQSIIVQSPVQAEHNVLNRMGTLIGCALISYLVIENILDKVSVWLMQFMHLHIELVFSGESRLYGDEQLVFWMTFGIQFLKYLIPALILQFVLKLPIQVSVPMKIRKPQKLISGIPLIMLLSAGIGMLSIPISADLEKYRLIYEMLNTEGNSMMLYILLTIFILPLMTELLLHGCMFQALRQFGDEFAILATAILAAALMHNISDAVRIGLIHLAISYYLIHTGSFWSAIFLRIVHEIYLFMIFCLETFDVTDSWEWWAVLFIPGVICIGIGVYLHRNQTTAPVQNMTYLKLSEKLEAFLTAMPMVAFLVCSILLLVITAMLA